MARQITIVREVKNGKHLLKIGEMWCKIILIKPKETYGTISRSGLTLKSNKGRIYIICLLITTLLLIGIGFLVLDGMVKDSKQKK
ncbi:MAG: hypothetical protein PUC65_01060 [Clostridiales bacterium]|nr:hypothetical protein [Clostridiales bacterium]